MNAFFLSYLQRTLNKYLSLDPETKSRLQKLAGRVITIELLPFHFIFQMLVQADTIVLTNQETQPADTKISGTPLQMVNLMLQRENRQQFFAADLKIEGDAELGQQIIAIFDELQIDWEEMLAKVVGDAPSYFIGNMFRKMSNLFSSTSQHFMADVNEYVHEEANWFPTREALQDFFTDIDNARMDVDRVEARIHFLQTRLTEHEEKQ